MIGVAIIMLAIVTGYFGLQSAFRVWLGIVIGTLGGLIALLVRTPEGQARLNRQRARLRRGLGDLARSFALRMSRQPTAE